MFTSKGLFAEVPCPHRDSCILPRCLFLHGAQTGARLSSERTSFQKLPNGSGVKLVSGDTDDGQRKRRKLANPSASQEGNLAANASSRPSRIDGPQRSTTPKQPLVGKENSTASDLVSSRQAVSPPPLNRPKAVTEPAKPSQGTNSLKPKQSANHAPRPAPKKEDLNPRMVKSAPASHDIRMRLLRALHEQYVRLNTELAKDPKAKEESLVLSDQEVITMALDVEENVAITKPKIYSNIIKNQIMLYKRMNITAWKEERIKALAAQIAEAITSESGTLPKEVKEKPKPIDTGLQPEEELKILPHVYTSIQGLEDHGYITAPPSDEAIEQARKGVEAAKGWEVCERCKTRFQVFPGRREEDGALTTGGKCTHHWGKAYMADRPANDPRAKRERKYRCCGQSLGESSGCTKAESHVFKVSDPKRLASVLQFERTPDNPNITSDRPVCIDGEMCFTVHGLELVRLTATSWPSGEELLDVLVRPVGEILDLSSRFSGVWPHHITNALPWTPDAPTQPLTPEESNGRAQRKLRIVSSPAKARELLFSHLRPTTPIIGHGLENDLNAVRIIHPTIIDTALLFPHKVGLPYRHALKTLTQQHLGRSIQQDASDGTMEGHDSKEDANAAGDLVRFAIGTEWQKMKLHGWKFENGELVEPSQRGMAAPLGASRGPRAAPTNHRLSGRYLEHDSSAAEESDGTPRKGRKRPYSMGESPPRRADDVVELDY